MSWITVANSGDLDEGAMMALEIDGRAIAIYRVGGRVFATENICTHGQATLTDGWLDGTIIECPLHGGRFDVCTGKGLGPPIETDLAIYVIREHDGAIQISFGGEEPS